MELLIVLWTLAIIGICAIGYYRWNKIRLLGQLGEWRVKSFIRLAGSLGLLGYYRAYHGVYIEYRAGKTTEIDHIILCEKGIIAIETKRWSGRIHGESTKSEWTQQLGRLRHAKYNPLMQHQAHTEILERLLREVVHGWVVRCGNGTWKVKNTSRIPLMNTWWLLWRLARLPRIYGASQIHHLESALTRYRKNTPS